PASTATRCARPTPTWRPATRAPASPATRCRCRTCRGRTTPPPAASIPAPATWRSGCACSWLAACWKARATRRTAGSARRATAPGPHMSWSNNTAAGGIYSSARDMAKWMRVQLAGGVLEGEGDAANRLFSAKRHEAMWTLVTPIPIRAPAVPELAATRPNFAGYGEAWNLSDYRGRRLVWHTGGWPGMVSRLTLVPDLGLGVVVLTNQEAGAAFNAITMHVLDAYMEAPATDW